MLFKKFSSLSVSFDVEDFSIRYAWIDSISNEEIRAKLAILSAKALEIITHLAVEGYSQRELVRKLGCSQNAISKRIAKIGRY